jgi:hypothetical protein
LARLAGAYADAVLAYWEYYYVSADIPIYFDGQPVAFGNPQIERNGYMFYPIDDLLRAFAESSEWCEETRKISGNSGENSVSVQIDELQYYINGEQLRAHEFFEPFIANDAVYVYLDIIAHALELAINWNEAERLIHVVRQAQPQVQ